MNSVIEKLAEVETTAETIVEHARQQKSEIERQIQEERDQFDRDLEEETQKKLEKIKEKYAAGSREGPGPGTEEEPD